MVIKNQFNQKKSFKTLAKEHQIRFRKEILNVGYDTHENVINEEAAKRGLNFYNDFDITKAVALRYNNKYSKHLYANLLRSEHIPFNLFIPLQTDLLFVKNVFNKLVSGDIKEILEIKIEEAPKPAKKYLDDKTSFDVLIKYLHKDNQVGVFGIEVKYTEGAYPLKKESAESRNILNKNSNYWQTMRKAAIFREGNDDELIKNFYRQIWRNQLLGEKMKQVDNIAHFTSITFYPKGNKHFTTALSNYQAFLKVPNTVLGITFEDFFETLAKHSNSIRFDKWIEYLKKRYIITQH